MGHCQTPVSRILPEFDHLEKAIKGLADEVVSKISGESWGISLKEKILDPLEMDETTTELTPDIENVAKTRWNTVSGSKTVHLRMVA